MHRSSSPRALRAISALPLSLALVFALLLSPSGPLAAQGFGGPPKASMELVADRTSYAPGESASIAARVTVESGWHMNSHTPTFPWLIPTDVTLAVPDGWAEPSVAYPPHQLKTFAFEDEPLAVYDGTVVFRIDLAVPESAASGDLPLDATLHFQACDDRQCLPPTSVTETVALPIGASGEPVEAELFRNAPSGAAGAAAEGPKQGRRPATGRRPGPPPRTGSREPGRPLPPPARASSPCSPWASSAA